MATTGPTTGGTTAPGTISYLPYNPYYGYPPVYGYYPYADPYYDGAGASVGVPGFPGRFRVQPGPGTGA